MKYFNRDLKLLLSRLQEIPKYFWYFLKCFWVFKEPLNFISAYLRVSPPHDNFVELREGLKIHLSEDPQDIVTVFIIFIREDYGEIASNQTIVDIGANIGVFSLYAAFSGAAIVYAFEPNTQVYQCLLQNIRTNNLMDVITPYHGAVSSVDGKKIKFPLRASVNNSIITTGCDSDYEIVDTISIQRVLCEKKKIDLLKVDCEGAEYDIFLNSKPEIFEIVQAVRMEYHGGRHEELISFMKRSGLSRSHSKMDSTISGNLWFHRT